MSDIHRSVQAAVKQLNHEAAWFDETYRTLNKYLKKTRGCYIGIHIGWFVLDMREGTQGKHLFRSESYTACLEYALAMPILESVDR